MPEAASRGFCPNSSLRAANGLDWQEMDVSVSFYIRLWYLRGIFVSDIAHSCHDRLTQMCCRPVTVVVMAAMKKEKFAIDV